MDLEAIKARAEAATPGPWLYNGSEVYSDQRAQTVALTKNSGRKGEDGQFIAHARADLPALVAEVERLRDELDKERRDWETECTARGMREEQIEAIAAELGSDAEWTSACDLGWHTRDLAGYVVGERDRYAAALDELKKHVGTQGLAIIQRALDHR